MLLAKSDVAGCIITSKCIKVVVLALLCLDLTGQLTVLIKSLA